MLAVDGVIVNDHISDITMGVAMLLAAYYNFSIMYPAGAAATLEHLQR